MANLMPGLFALNQTMMQPSQPNPVTQGLFTQLQGGLSGNDDLTSIAGIDKAIMNATAYGNTGKAAQLAKIKQDMLNEQGRNTRATMQRDAQVEIANMRDRTSRYGIDVQSGDADANRNMRKDLAVFESAERAALQTTKLEADAAMLRERLAQSDVENRRALETKLYTMERNIDAEMEMLGQKLSNDQKLTILKGALDGADGATALAGTMPSDTFVEALDSVIKEDPALMESLGFDDGAMWGIGPERKKEEGRAKREKLYFRSYNLLRNGRGEVGLSEALKRARRLEETPDKEVVSEGVTYVVNPTTGEWMPKP